MAIAYLPSEGGINKVGLTKDNLWFGDKGQQVFKYW
jgi:hypothetical protein